MRKSHGQHNLDLCNMLLEQGDYNDWVVTTAFYSATHFVEHALFPLIEDGIEYQDFNEYWQNKPRTLQDTSKHTCKKNLVRTYLKPVSAAYRELLDDCHNYRYNEYVVSNYNAETSKRKADIIKKACLEKKP